MMEHKNILLIQQRYRFLSYLVNNYNNKRNDLDIFIYQISSMIIKNYSKEIINQFSYNKNLSKLDEINTLSASLPKNILLRNFNIKLIIKINKSYEILTEVSKDCGIESFSSLLKLLNIKFSNKELTDILNNSFNICDYSIFNKNKTKSSAKKLILYKGNEKSNILNYDYVNISKLKKFLFVKQFKKSLSFIENICGCRLYLRCDNNLILIIDGYLNNDPLNIFRSNNLFRTKEISIKEELKNLNIDIVFKNSYLKQLSLRDFLLLDENQIIEKIKNDYFMILNYKNKSLSVLVKDFLAKNCHEQVNFITLFLLFEEDSEIQNMAYLLYDMICNESYLLKPSNDGQNIFNSLHWSIQKVFKDVNKKITTELKNMENLNIEEISYEKRIYLMKVDNNIKQKAMDKLKEISNKSNDNSTKATQYLDNLLKIPFGIYQKEEIMCSLEKFTSNFFYNIKQLKSYSANDNKLNQISNICFSILKKNKIYYDEILFNIRKMNNCIKLLNNNIFDNKELIDNTLNNYIKNNKNLVLENLINKINKDIPNINYKPKGTKKYYYEIFSGFFSNSSIDIKIKQIYMDIINNSKNNNETDKKFLKIKSITNTLNNNLNDYNSKVSSYLNNSSKILDDAIYGQDEAKIEIKRIISQWINGEMNGYCLGFEGPPGTGKTTIAKQGIAECLRDNDKSRPFSFIALGGSSNGSTLEGHNYTYLGSTHGKIVDILIESKCMNPIIYIDELDKISNTENGKELIGILTHLTDSSQNEHFNDKYFAGIDFDLSKVLFIFSYNDYNKLDKILADRIHRIKFNYMSTEEKVIIMNNYLIPKLTKDVGLKNMIEFDNDIIKYIIHNYTMEGGVRKLKERVFEIIRQINLDLLSKKNYLDDIEGSGLLVNNKIKLTEKMIDEIFEKKCKLLQKNISLQSKKGLVNGLYATSAGTGGITLIEALKTFHETKLSLVITGQQGDVMKESIICAKTIAWNLLPKQYQENIYKDLKKNSFGIHIHCPEAATPKDGPSAGTAITIAILSMLSNLKVKNDIALTGEIDLNGNVHAVGGIDLKIEGGKNAGIKTILLPFENKQDYDVILKSKPKLIDGINIIFVKNVWEVIPIIFEENSINFEKYV